MGQSLPEATPLTPAQQVAFLSQPVDRKRHTTYLNLGALGDEVEARAEWLLQVDEHGYIYVEIATVRLIPPPFYGRVECFADLPESVIHDIEEEIKEAEGIE